MTREEFMDVVYSELHSDGDNCRANRIIDAADEYKEADREYVLDKIRAEIEHHRRKTEGIDPYDLVGDCLDIIDKYKEESDE